MRCFILDDEIGVEPRKGIIRALEPRHELTVVKSCKDAKAIYKPGYDLLLLDHDMRGYFDPSDHPSTAYHFVKLMVLLFHPKKPRIILHSQNPDGRRNMLKVFHDHGFQNVDEWAFAPSYVKFLETL